MKEFENAIKDAPEQAKEKLREMEEMANSDLPIEEKFLKAASILENLTSELRKAVKK